VAIYFLKIGDDKMEFLAKIGNFFGNIIFNLFASQTARYMRVKNDYLLNKEVIKWVTVDLLGATEFIDMADANKLVSDQHVYTVKPTQNWTLVRIGDKHSAMYTYTHTETDGSRIVVGIRMGLFVEMVSAGQIRVKSFGK